MFFNVGMGGPRRGSKHLFQGEVNKGKFCIFEEHSRDHQNLIFMFEAQGNNPIGTHRS